MSKRFIIKTLEIFRIFDCDKSRHAMKLLNHVNEPNDVQILKQKPLFTYVPFFLLYPTSQLWYRVLWLGALACNALKEKSFIISIDFESLFDSIYARN